MLPFQTIYTTKNDLFGEFEKGRSSTLDPHCGRPGGLYEIIKAFMWSLYQWDSTL